jgi:type IV secretion system protein VirB4
MWRTAAFRTRRPGLADLLPWANLADSGLVVTKRGALLVGFYFRPPDSASSTNEMTADVSRRVHEAVGRFGTGWASWTDVASIPADTYPPPDASHFPDPVSRMVDDERRRTFQAEGAHFENERAFLVSYLPPAAQSGKLSDMLYEGVDRETETPLSRTIEGFQREVHKFVDQCGRIIGLRRMQSYAVEDAFGRRHMQDELVNYLNYCATARANGIMLPASGAYLDTLIGGQEMWTGERPVIGREHVACVVIDGFPAEHHANIVAALNTLPMPYRFSQRMIYLDPQHAVREVLRFEKYWGQKVRGLATAILSQHNAPVNEHALAMRLDARAAASVAESGDGRFGWYSATVILRHESLVELEEMARTVERVINDCGFGSRIETTNTVEAWLGAQPGDTDANVRRPILHTEQLADLLPLSGIWTGHNHAPCPLYDQSAPPLMHAATVGGIPFRVNLHVDDVGHTMIFGPIGMGKSTLLAGIAMQARRYRGMHIWSFDNKMGLFATTKACGGRHYELGGEASPGLCPLAHLETQGDRTHAEEWLSVCYELQANKPLDPDQRAEIHNAVRRLSEDKDGTHRSLTDFLMAVQDKEVRMALQFYTLDGAAGHLLDARNEEIEDSDFAVFETGTLLPMGEKIGLPVLLSMFRSFERSLDGRPALLLLDEAWTVLGHAAWRGKLFEWLRRLRSFNCAVVLATQSLSDAVRSGLLDVLLESCPTKFFLPNPEARKKGTAEQPGPLDFYRIMGLNDNQIGIIQTAVPKRDYYMVTPEGARLITFDFGPVALSFIGATSKEDVNHVRRLVEQHGDAWPFEHLKMREVDHEALA